MGYQRAAMLCGILANCLYIVWSITRPENVLYGKLLDFYFIREDFLLPIWGVFSIQNCSVEFQVDVVYIDTFLDFVTNSHYHFTVDGYRSVLPFFKLK